QLNESAEAIKLVNQIRSRAANSTQMISSYPSKYGVKFYCKNYSGSYSAEETLKIVKMERRLELAMESERFLDLVRWGDAANVLNEYFDQEKYRCNIYEGANFTANKNEYLPIPYQQVAAANGNYKQNCGNW
ncbi:MAG: RagB/SusD family nutrient uptake outer membrane protein, partial [Bacteroidales bacterium]|nr:RagB/SusD family nutrient uptake outer membrane protein [Bacteroidales bacterium]